MKSFYVTLLLQNPKTTEIFTARLITIVVFQRLIISRSSICINHHSSLSDFLLDEEAKYF